MGDNVKENTQCQRCDGTGDHPGGPAGNQRCPECDGRGFHSATDEFAPVMAIRLRKEGEHTVVDAEIGGDWIEVIRERSDGEFCHIVEKGGIMSSYYAMPVEKPLTPSE